MRDKGVGQRFAGHGPQLSCMMRIMLKIGSCGSYEERNILVESLRYTTCSSAFSEFCWNVLPSTSCINYPSSETHLEMCTIPLTHKLDREYGHLPHFSDENDLNLTKPLTVPGFQRLKYQKIFIHSYSYSYSSLPFSRPESLSSINK
jgi:hypothetical protein